MSSELRQPECFYDQAHCSAFCEKEKKDAGGGGAGKGSTTEEGSTSLQAIRLVCPVQVLRLAQSFVASVENPFSASPPMTLSVTLVHCRVTPAQCVCDSGDCKAFVRLERCHSRIRVRSLVSPVHFRQGPRIFDIFCFHWKLQGFGTHSVRHH